MIAKRSSCICPGFIDDSVGFPTDVGNLQRPPGFLIRAILRNGLAHEIGCKRRQPVILAFRPAIFDRKRSGLRLIRIRRAPGERVKLLVIGERGGVQHTDYRQRRLLRARCDRPRCHAAAPPSGVLGRRPMSHWHRGIRQTRVARTQSSACVSPGWLHTIGGMRPSLRRTNSFATLLN
jgi:hypothetical protein